MATDIEAIEKQIAELQDKRDKAIAETRAQMVKQVREAIRKYEITLTEVKNVLTMRKKRASKGAAVAKKATSGKRRGRPPKVKAA